MVHCICTCDTQLCHLGIYGVIADRSIASCQEIFQSIPVEDKEVCLPWKKLIGLHNTHICHSAQQIKQQTSTAALQYKSSLLLPLRGKKTYNEITQTIVDCDECSTYWQKAFDIFVNTTHSNENTTTIICAILNHSQGNVVIEIQQVSCSCPDPIFFKNKYPNPILIRKHLKYPAGYPILVLSMLTSVVHVLCVSFLMAFFMSHYFYFNCDVWTLCFFVFLLCYVHFYDFSLYCVFFSVLSLLHKKKNKYSTW